MTYEHKWLFPAEVEDVKDGDTISAWIDQGFNEWRFEDYLRFNRIDAYETSLRRGTTPAQKNKGLEGKSFLKELIEEQEIYLRIFKKKKGSRRGKYGRYIIEVYILDTNTNLYTDYSKHINGLSRTSHKKALQHKIEGLVNINDLMVAKKYAIYKDY